MSCTKTGSVKTLNRYIGTIAEGVAGTSSCVAASCWNDRVLATSRPQKSVVDRAPTEAQGEEGGVAVEVQRAQPKIILHFKGKGLVTFEEVLLLRKLKRKQQQREARREKRRQMKASEERAVREHAEIFLNAVQAAWD